MLNKLNEISNEVKRALVFKIQVLTDANELGQVYLATCRLTDEEGKSAVFTINFGSESPSKGTSGIGYFIQYQKYLYVDGQKTDKKNGMGLFCSYVDEEEQAE